MTDSDTLRSAFRDSTKPAKSNRALRREKRADATRAQALSPVRILTSVLLVPVVTGALTVSIYIRTSPFEREDALRHLIALSGCSAALKFGVPHAARGEPGYHARNDTNHDGIACNENDPAFPGMETVDRSTPLRNAGGAKFLRP